MATTKYNSPKKAPSANPYGATKLAEVDMGVANIDKSNQSYPTKTTGIVTRGNGCAVRGKTARGPMA